ncbi:MAG: OmpA family protein [Buchnera aphidicola (Melaphis rhois)]
MKLNRILKTIIFIFPIIAMFSCSFQKDKINKNISNKDTQVIDTKLDTDSNENLDILKQDNVVYFDFNKYNINAKFAKTLNNIATFLYEHPDVNIVIEGHTDKRGSEQYNVRLGQHRADAVKLYLQSKGILSKQISTISYGSDKPAEIGDKEDSYSKNRRAVIAY